MLVVVVALTSPRRLNFCESHGNRVDHPAAPAGDISGTMERRECNIQQSVDTAVE
jgi:hypothetical protein